MMVPLLDPMGELTGWPTGKTGGAIAPAVRRA